MTVSLKPILRALKYTWLYRTAQLRTLSVNRALSPERLQPITFVIGCGRSGTTILGEVLSDHPQVLYHFEPYHLWTAVDYRTDVANLFHRGEAQLLMDKTDMTADVQRLFPHLFRPQSGQMLIEKTPLNVFRIGYLKALVPHAKFVHIVRDGVDVAHSIGRLAATSSYKIAGKPELNQWWGVERCRWHILQREGAEAGYWPDEVKHLHTEQQRGAYEWLTSLSEMGRWQADLGNSLHEILYPDLVGSPGKVLDELCDFLELEIPPDWLASACSAIKAQPHRLRSVELPEKMAGAFNNYQQQYQFPQKALLI